MSKKKVMIVAGVIATLGAVAAVSAQGHRGWRGDGMRGDGEFGRRGMFNRSITADEFDARTRERFARIDKNSDGFLDAAEIEAAMAARHAARGGPGAPGGQMGERFLRMFDENKDGKVSKEEFDNYVKKRFAEADLNNDGKISDDDLPPMMRGRNVLSGEGGGMMGPGFGGPRGPMGGGGMMLGFLRGADANKDGVITLDEALAHAGKFFARMDRNKDNVIDKADFELMRKEMADYQIKRFIHRYGADKDGKVSREQFLKHAKERFARADINGDGVLTRDELPGRSRWGGPHGGPGGWHGRGGFGGDQPGMPGMGGPGFGGPRGGGMMGPGGPGRGPGGPGPSRGGEEE